MNSPPINLPLLYPIVRLDTHVECDKSAFTIGSGPRLGLLDFVCTGCTRCAGYHVYQLYSVYRLYFGLRYFIAAADTSPVILEFEDLFCLGRVLFPSISLVDPDRPRRCSCAI